MDDRPSVVEHERSVRLIELAGRLVRVLGYQEQLLGAMPPCQREHLIEQPSPVPLPPGRRNDLQFVEVDLAPSVRSNEVVAPAPTDDLATLLNHESEAVFAGCEVTGSLPPLVFDRSVSELLFRCPTSVQCLTGACLSVED